MSNTHLLPDVLAELMARDGDLLAPAVLGSTLAVPVPGSMTLPAFTCWGYVRVGTPTRLCYVNQAAASVTLAGGDGLYWLALFHDTSTAVSGWTRRPGTHYLWLAAGTQPADPPGGLVWASMTVAGGVITAVNTTLAYPVGKVAYGGATGALAFDNNLTWDGTTLKVRNAVDAFMYYVPDHPGDGQVAFHTHVNAAGGTNRWALYAGGTAPSHLGGSLGVTGQVSLGGTLAVAGETTLNSTLYVTGATTLNNTLSVAWPVQPNYELTTNRLYAAGVSRFNSGIGLNGDALGGYSLTAHGSSQLAANVTIGMIGTAATATLDVNGSTRLRGTLQMDSSATVNGVFSAVGAAVCYSTFQVNGTALCASTLQVQGALTWAYYATGPQLRLGDAVPPGYTLDVNGDAMVRGHTGLGVPPAPGQYHLNCGSANFTSVNVNTLTATAASVGSASLSSTLVVSGATTLNADAQLAAGARLLLGTGMPVSNFTQGIAWPHASGYGLIFRPSDGNDVGAGHPIQFYSAGGGVVGNISTSGSGTSFNTTSDRRAKEAIVPLHGSEAIVQALRPVTFRWRATGTAGVGFVADEVQAVVPDAVTGTPDSPTLQGMDASKLLPYVVGTLHAILQRLDALEEAYARAD